MIRSNWLFLFVLLSLVCFSPLQADVTFAVSDLFSLNTAFDEHRWATNSDLFELNTAFQPDDRIVLSLEEGWNIVSLNISPSEEYWTREEGPNVVRLMDRLRDADDLLVSLVKDQYGRFYTPVYEYCGIPYWDLTQGYQVAMVVEINGVTIYGDPIPADGDIPQVQGWNMTAYFPTYELDASAPDFYVLSPIEEQLLFAKNSYGEYIAPEYEFSNMPNWREGQGYQIKVSQDVTLNYPQERQQLAMADGDQSFKPYVSNRALAVSQTAISDKHWPDPTLTGANQSLLITAFQGRNIPNGSQVAALDGDGKVVGLGTVKDGRCGLAVWGDDASTEVADGLSKGAEFELRLWDVKQAREVKLTVATVQQGAGLVYETDSFTALTLADAQAVPEEYFLAGAYPNPFNSTVRLSYGLPENSLVQIRVYDIQGRQVASLLDAEQTAGFHVVMWSGDAIASGIYFVKMEAKAFQATRKITLVK